MTEETKKALEAFVLQIIEAAKSGAQWTSEQTPLLVQEWLGWQFASTLLIIIALVVVGAIFAGFSRFFWHKKKQNPRDDWEAGGIAFMAGGFLTLVPIFINAMYLTKLMVAPRVVVFEKFIELIK